MSANNLVAKTGHLSRFILKLDRIRIPIWLISITFFTLVVPPAYSELYSSQQERDAMAETMQNPAMIAMAGPADVLNYTIGVMTAHAMLLMTAVVVGLMSILLVTRHTRADEEDGRIELIRSLPAGRLSYLNATLIVSVITSIALALLNGLGLYALGIESMDLEGSLLYGVALGATALFFAGVTAVFAQLTETSRGTIGYSIAFLLGAYLFRGITDVSNESLSWISPLGWVTKAEVYGANHWWPMVLMVGVSLVLFVLANYLNAIRDLERGFMPSKPGRRNASKFLQGPIGLALKLQRTGLIAWAVGMYILGASYGSVFGDLEAFIGSNEMMSQMLLQMDGVSIAEQFLPMLMVVITLIGTVPPLMAINKLRGEEKKGRLEHLIGRAVSRTQLMSGYLLVAVLNGFVMVSLGAIGLWSAASAVMDEPIAFGTIYGAAISYYPAILVMVGLAVFLIGFVPKWTSLTWMYVIYSFLVLYLGGLFDLEDWIGNISPFGHVPQAPIEEVTAAPLVVLSVIAAGLMVIGMIGFRKRDLEG
ncbi:ABC transporter permease [Evansella tamaricis]|uniref:ABC transporter permease n=1 Tax=Evansella tamaricis TaxID=2069301 RepID=A0ABS6JHT0_9BACI|nr:ABC transporter permease [Evansella tamaricis]MBU9713221.1 ABC transporter permease [Evansella tamaricis]